MQVLYGVNKNLVVRGYFITKMTGVIVFRISGRGGGNPPLLTTSCAGDDQRWKQSEKHCLPAGQASLKSCLPDPKFACPTWLTNADTCFEFLNSTSTSP